MTEPLAVIIENLFAPVEVAGIKGIGITIDFDKLITNPNEVLEELNYLKLGATFKAHIHHEKQVILVETNAIGRTQSYSDDEARARSEELNIKIRMPYIGSNPLLEQLAHAIAYPPAPVKPEDKLARLRLHIEPAIRRRATATAELHNGQPPARGR